MVLDIDRDLHVVAHDAGAATARCHRAAVRVGQRYLLIWRSQHLLLHRREALHLASELGELLLEVCRLGRKRLRRLLQIGRVELAQIPRDARLKLRPAPLYFRARKVAVAIVDGLELAPSVFASDQSRQGLRPMPASRRKRTNRQTSRQVYFVPTPDSCSATNLLIRSPRPQASGTRG